MKIFTIILLALCCIGGIAFAQITAIDATHIQENKTRRITTTVDVVCARSASIDAEAKEADIECAQANQVVSNWIAQNPVQTNQVNQVSPSQV